MREHVQTTGGRSYAAQPIRELVETCSLCRISIIWAKGCRRLRQHQSAVNTAYIFVLIGTWPRLPAMIKPCQLLAHML